MPTDFTFLRYRIIYHYHNQFFWKLIKSELLEQRNIITDKQFNVNDDCVKVSGGR